MIRRNALKNMFGLLTGGVAALFATKAEAGVENPLKLPEVRFDENKEMANVKELLSSCTYANVDSHPFHYFDSFVKEKKVWVHQKDAVKIHCFEKEIAWGEFLLKEKVVVYQSGYTSIDVGLFETDNTQYLKYNRSCIMGSSLLNKNKYVTEVLAQLKKEVNHAKV